MEDLIKYLIENGVDPMKLILNVAASGKWYELKNSENNGVNAAATVIGWYNGGVKLLIIHLVQNRTLLFYSIKC